MIKFPINKYGFDKYDKSKYYIDENGNEGWQDIPAYDKTYSLTINVTEKNNDTVPYYTERFAINLLLDNSIESVNLSLRASNSDEDDSVNYFDIPERDRTYVVEGLDPINIINHTNKWSAYAYYDTALHRLAFFRGTSGQYINKEVQGTRIYFTDIEECEHSENSIPWNEYKSDVQSVRFLDPIFPISTAYWFSNMPNLSLIENIYYLDTSNVSNFDSMFKNCSSLKTLDLSYFNTYKVRIMNSMFEGCTHLSKLKIQNLKLIHTHSANNMFKNCSRIQSSLILDRIPIEHTDMFANCATTVGSTLSVYDTPDNTIVEDEFEFENGVQYGGHTAQIDNLTYSISDIFDYNQYSFMYVRGGDMLEIKDIQAYYNMTVEAVTSQFSTYEIHIHTDSGVRGYSSYTDYPSYSTAYYSQQNVTHDIFLDMIALQTQAYATYESYVGGLEFFRSPKQLLLNAGDIYTDFEKSDSEPGWVTDNLDVQFIYSSYYDGRGTIRPISTRNWFNNIPQFFGQYDLSVSDNTSNMLKLAQNAESSYLITNGNHIYNSNNMLSSYGSNIEITGVDELSNDMFEYLTNEIGRTFQYNGYHMRMLFWAWNDNIYITLLSPYNTVPQRNFYVINHYKHSEGYKYGSVKLNSYTSHGELVGIEVQDDHIITNPKTFSDWLSVFGIGDFIIDIDKLEEKIINHSPCEEYYQLNDCDTIKIYQGDSQIYSSSVSDFFDSLDHFTRDYYNSKLVWGTQNEYSCYVYNIDTNDEEFVLVYDVTRNDTKLENVRFVFSKSGQDDIILYPDATYSVWSHSTGGTGLNYIPYSSPGGTTPDEGHAE